MSSRLTITFSDVALQELASGKAVTVHLGSGGGGSPVRAAAAPRKSVGKRGKAASAPREGSLPVRIAAWAQKRKTAFGPADLTKKFKVTRGHASMLLTNMVKRGLVKRLGRGAYEG